MLIPVTVMLAMFDLLAAVPEGSPALAAPLSFASYCAAYWRQFTEHECDIPSGWCPSPAGNPACMARFPMPFEPPVNLVESIGA